MSSSVADSSWMAGLISWTNVCVALLSILRWTEVGEFSGFSRTCRAQLALQVVGNWIKLQDSFVGCGDANTSFPTGNTGQRLGSSLNT